MQNKQLIFTALAVSTLLAIAQAAADPPGRNHFSHRDVARLPELAQTSKSALPAGHRFKDWTEAMPVVEVNDTGFPDGCPIESPDGLSLYIASARPGEEALGAMDIWAADRPSKDALFGEPEHLDAPVNSAAADFCPTPLDGRWLMFVSERSGPETCNAHPPVGELPGSGDIYIIRQNASGSWAEPQHLGCLETGTGPNSQGAEFSPSLVTLKHGTFLYFSSTVSGNMDIYVSRLRDDGVFGPPSPVQALNTEFDDRMPNVSADGLEVVFSSNRPVDAYGTVSKGSFDVYVSTRFNPHGTWSAPRNLGDKINKGGSETRSSLSRDMQRLYFGRDGEIYSSTREKRKPRH